MYLKALFPIIYTEKIFTTSCERISDLSNDFLKDGLSIQFVGEAGMGSGVRREWFDNLSKEILNPDYALFTQSADGEIKCRQWGCIINSGFISEMGGIFTPSSQR